MPRGDRTGPAGLGPRTGRRAGYCSGYSMPGFANPWVPGRGGRGGRGWGRDMGRGFGWGYTPYGYALPTTPWGQAFNAPWGPVVDASWGPGFGAPWGQAPTREQETEFLKDQQEFLKQQMEDITKRIHELEAEIEK